MPVSNFLLTVQQAAYCVGFSDIANLEMMIFYWTAESPTFYVTSPMSGSQMTSCVFYFQVETIRSFLHCHTHTLSCCSVLTTQQSDKSLYLYGTKIWFSDNKGCNCISHTMSHPITYILNKCEMHLLKWNPRALFEWAKCLQGQNRGRKQSSCSDCKSFVLERKIRKSEKKIINVCISPWEKMSKTQNTDLLPACISFCSSEMVLGEWKSSPVFSSNYYFHHLSRLL